MNSARRRHHYKRLQKKRRRFWLVWDLFNRFDHNPRTLGMLTRTPHPCSGNCCGNPRKYFNQKTIQERRNLQKDN